MRIRNDPTQVYTVSPLVNSIQMDTRLPQTTINTMLLVWVGYFKMEWLLFYSFVYEINSCGQSYKGYDRKLRL